QQLIILTCMDSRIDVMNACGLNLGEAHIIRNAGGRASDALRSIIISQRMLGTREIAVIHHTQCGIFTFKNADLHATLEKDHPEHKKEIEKIDFLTLDGLEQGVLEDVKYLKEHPLLVPGTVVTGWIIDVKSG
ncbi:carbonic anhydrase, partial [Auriculariales sp. MPI-PUGE-AT-0066]